MTCINVDEFVLISYLEKDHSMIETRRLKNVVIFNLKLFLHALFVIHLPPLLIHPIKLN